MKKLIILIITTLLIVVIVVSATGCENIGRLITEPFMRDTRPPSEEELPPPSSLPSPPAPVPPPELTPSPSITPTPSSDPFGLGLLVPNQYYFQDGNELLSILMFFENGTCIYKGSEAGFLVSDSIVEIVQEGVMISWLTIIDEGTLEETGGDGMRFMLDIGGSDAYDPFSADGTRILFFDRFYYMERDDDDRLGLLFRRDSTVRMELPDGVINGGYVIGWNDITVTLENERVFTLAILDCTTFTDTETDARYALSGSQDTELVYGEHYYLLGDETAGSILFFSDGTLELKDPDGTVTRAAYTVSDEDGHIIYEYDGNESVIVIKNSFILDYEEGISFIRLP